MKATLFHLVKANEKKITALRSTSDQAKKAWKRGAEIVLKKTKKVRQTPVAEDLLSAF